MTAEHLFDSRGAWIAYRVARRFVWSRDGEWVGWCPWPDDPDVVIDPGGAYLGHVMGNRLLRRSSVAARPFPGYPPYPGYRGAPGEPDGEEPIDLPEGAADVRLARPVPG